MTAKELESVLLTPGLKLTTTTIFRRQIVKVTDEAIALHFLICGTLLGQSPTASPSRPAPARLLSVCFTECDGYADQPTQRFGAASRAIAKRSCKLVTSRLFR